MQGLLPERIWLHRSQGALFNRRPPVAELWLEPLKNAGQACTS
jgi:hypothetical protein